MKRYRAYADGGFFEHPEGEWVMHDDLPSRAEAEQTVRERDLAMMIRRLAARIRLRSRTGPHATPDMAMSEAAMDFLKRLGLEGSPVRDEPALTNGDDCSTSARNIEEQK